jgi:diguanylate cyclase (GGDEF)-like protein
MRKNIPNGLYKKLAAYSVLIAFSFGLVISFYQIYRDYNQQESRLILEINQRVSLIQGSAEKAIYEFDESLAQIVIDSIAEHPAVLNLTIYDDYNDIFKSKIVRSLKPRPNWLPDFLVLSTKTLDYPLEVKSEVKHQNARIKVEVDPFLVVDDLVDRSLLNITSGLIRYIFLAIVLLYLSYRLVTKSIYGLGRDLSKIDPMDSSGELLKIPIQHKHNELGSLATMINNLLIKIRQGISQISNLNSELNQQLVDKAQIEKALNLAEERTAGRTGKDYIKTMVEFIGYTLALDGVAIYRQIESGSSVVYKPVASILNGRWVKQKTLKLEDLPLEILNRNFEIVTMDLTTDDKDNVFHSLYGVILPIRNRRRNIVNLLQLVSAKPFSSDFYQQYKSLLQILSSRFITESERERSEQLILDLAHIDNLTKLSNRNHFLELLKKTIRGAEHENEKVILIHVDVNNFKWINESYGYTVGDQLLIQIALRLKKLIPESSQIARVGGDEFIITMKVKHENFISQLSQNIHTAIKKTFIIENHIINAKVSIGIAMYPDNASSDEELIKHADYAVNMAKKKDSIRTQYFTHEVAEQIERKLLITKLLNNAIDFSLLNLNYQPIYSFKNGKIIAVEVLCRWNNPQLGVVSPEEFIPIAEESGLIHKLGSWVLNETIATMKLLAEQLPNHELIKVAVNFSAHQLNNPTLVQQYLDKIRQESIDPLLITFEITESMLIDDLGQASEILGKITALGCNISIDDFGTGYSSLQYLKHLPIKNLKIDKTFINGITDQNSDINIVKAIISLANAMNMNVIAEGVETREQVKILSQLNCDLMQGYYFAKPLNIDDLLQKLSEQRIEEYIV